jgi:hypothetical protein
MRLTHLASFVFSFTIIFVITSILLTFKHIWIYLSKMFDLPIDIIISMISLRELNNDNKDEEV